MSSKSQNPVEKPAKRRHPLLRAIGAIVGVLVVLLVAYGVVLGTSVATVQSQATELQKNAQALQSALDESDVSASVDAARQVSSDVDNLAGELDGWQWDIAELLPYYGSDVRAGRSVVAVAQNLSQKILLPVATVAADYAAGFDAKGILAVFDTSLLKQVAQTCTEAAPAIQEAASALDAIGPTHIAELNQAVEELRDPVDKAAQILDRYGTLVDHLDFLGNLLGISK